MSFWCEIVCFVCSDSIAGTHVRGGRFPVREMERVAKRNGWTKKTNEGWSEHLCADCTHMESTGHQVHKGRCFTTGCEWSRR